MLAQYIAESYKKVGYLLIAASFIKRKPVSRSLVINSQEHSSVWFQILCNPDKVIVAYVGINSQRKVHVLTVSANIAHIAERLVLCISADTSLVSKVIVVWIIPCKAYVRTGMNLACTSRPALIKRIVAVHQTDASVRSSQLVKNIILIDIFSSFTSVSEIDGAFSLSHMDPVNLFFHFLYSCLTKFICQL